MGDLQLHQTGHGKMVMGVRAWVRGVQERWWIAMHPDRIWNKIMHSISSQACGIKGNMFLSERGVLGVDKNAPGERKIDTIAVAFHSAHECNCSNVPRVMKWPQPSKYLILARWWLREYDSGTRAGFAAIWTPPEWPTDLGGGVGDERNGASVNTMWGPIYDRSDASYKSAILNWITLFRYYHSITVSLK